MELAANWPDKSPECLVSPLIDLETRAIGRQGASGKTQRERLSEGTFQFSWVNKRSDSPNPEKILRAIKLWEEGVVWKVISLDVGVSGRTLRRYLTKLGYKRDYSFISQKLKEYVKTKNHREKISFTRKSKGSARGEKNPNWKGGINNKKISIWNTVEYKEWRTSIFERDKYVCRGCGIKNGDGKTIYLEAHHILPRRDFPHLTFDLSNGITLCKECHDKTRKKEYLSINIWKQRVQKRNSLLLLEKDFRKIHQDQYVKIPKMVPDLFNIQKSNAAFEKTSAVGQVPDFVEFTGKISEVSPTQGYDKTYTFTEFAAKIEIQRKLAADDQYRVMNRYPKNLAVSASRSREKSGASLFDLAFTFEPTDGDGAELCASDHDSNVATTASQSNEGTSALSATNVETTRIAMHAFKDDIGELISVMPDTIIIPRALEQTGWEIINTKGKVDTAENNENFHKGKYKLVVWDRLTDTTDWFNKIDPRFNQRWMLN